MFLAMMATLSPQQTPFECWSVWESTATLDSTSRTVFVLPSQTVSTASGFLDARAVRYWHRWAITMFRLYSILPSGTWL